MESTDEVITVNIESNSSPLTAVTTAISAIDNAPGVEKASSEFDEIDTQNLMVIESAAVTSIETVKESVDEDYNYDDDDDYEGDENIIIDVNVVTESTETGTNSTSIPHLSIIKKKTEKAKWSSEEDEILKKAVALHGTCRYYCF